MAEKTLVSIPLRVDPELADLVDKYIQEQHKKMPWLSLSRQDVCKEALYRMLNSTAETRPVEEEA